MADKKYFQHFEKIDLNGLKIVNLAQRSVFMRSVKINQVMVGDYRVKDGETAWSLSWDFYGDTDYYWVILHMNDTVDPFFRWPLTQSELTRYVEQVYGDERDSPHHWILDNRKYLSDPGHPESYEITNYQHEDIENENRRHIKILRPEYLGKAIKQFERSMRPR